MKNHLRIAFFAFNAIFIWLMLGCVSVKLPSSKTQKATSVIYPKPSSTFVRFYPEHVDAAWRNSKNGNSISFYSECKNDDGPSHKSIQKGLLRSISSAKVQRELSVQVSREKALRSIISGEVDGKVSLVDLIIFNKEDCIFILTYVGKKDSFLENQKDFEKFYTEFEVKE